MAAALGGTNTTGSSTTGGSGSGTGSTGTSTTTTGGSDGGLCEKFIVEADRAAPDMLIVMDASGSMSLNLRWEPAVDAVKDITQALENDIQFGLMLFPANGIGCQVGQLDVPMATMNAQAIANHLDGVTVSLGNTPTSTTLAQAGQVLAQREPVVVGGPEGFALPQYVMLVTDGNPNCVTDTSPVPMLNEDPAAQQAAIDEISALASANVQTYVIGIDSANDANFAGILDQMAAAGGTGETTHRSVSGGNPDALLQEFQSITSNAVSCSFVLQQNVDPQKLNVYLNDNKAEYGTDWTIRDDMRTVDLLEGSCSDLQLGAKLEAEVVCKVVNVI